MEGSQPAYPLVFLIFESLAFTASTLCPSSVTHLSQLLLRGVDVVHQGPGQVTELNIPEYLFKSKASADLNHRYDISIRIGMKQFLLLLSCQDNAESGRLSFFFVV